MTRGNYARLIELLFFRSYVDGVSSVPFARTDISTIATENDISIPKNLGDLVYAFRYRRELPNSIRNTAPANMEWIIRSTGRDQYEFQLVRESRIIPRPDLMHIKIPDSTPEIISQHAMSDEQALLAVLRYNRLIDIFLGITTYSLQNHLRTTLLQGNQIEIDEVYVGIDQKGQQYIIPVQAKGGSDQLGSVQAMQDIEWAGQKFPDLIVKPVSAQFLSGSVVALLELALQEDQVVTVEERHYALVPHTDL